MNREVAVAVLKEVFDVCQHMNATAITLMPATAEGKGYQIHINTTLDLESRKCLNEIMEKHGLKFRERTDRIVIYNPKIPKPLL